MLLLADVTNGPDSSVVTILVILALLLALICMIVWLVRR
jgi:flagellar biogenesis protein FliO